MNKLSILAVILLALAIAYFITWLPSLDVSDVAIQHNDWEYNISANIISTKPYDTMHVDMVVYDGDGAKIDEQQGIWGGNLTANELTKFDAKYYPKSRFKPVSAKLIFYNGDDKLKEEKIYF